MSGAPWERLADVLLQREAACCRLVAGVPPRDTPGLYVTDEDLTALLRTLPGLDWPADEAVAPVRERFAEPVERAWQEFTAWAESAPDLAGWAGSAGATGVTGAASATGATGATGGASAVGAAGPNGAADLAGVAAAAGGTLGDAAVLAVLTAVELSPQRQRLVCYVQDDIHLPRLTAPTLGRLLSEDSAGLRALAPGAPLRLAELLVVGEVGPWGRRMFGVADRVAWAAVGDDTADPGLPAGATLRRVTGPAPSSPGGPTPGLLLVHGADAESRRTAAARVFGAANILLSPLPGTAAEWAALVREATVSRAAVILELSAELPTGAAAAVERAGHLAWVLSSPSELPLEGLPAVPYRELAVRDGTARRRDWLGRVGSGAPDGVVLTREQLRLVAAAAGGDPERVPAAVRRLAGGHLDRLAVRVRPRCGWGDLVVPPTQLAQLRQLVARHRGRAQVFGQWGFPAQPSPGAVALFAGPSGTGKTLAAEVVAGELGLDLYKVDLASVVSKYIGETEKNLERIFTAAAAGDLVLFFDEADALFGKRSEVSDSHDRYANIEVAYLLQRLETYEGLVVLATNLQRNIDEAFLRRIGVAVTFTSPDEEQRRRIWSLAFPRQAPVADLDVDFLARQFTVTGGVIRSAALGAAFMAAEAGEPITMERIAVALRREFSKLGHLSTESEFERYFDVVRREAVS